MPLAVPCKAHRQLTLSSHGAGQTILERFATAKRAHYPLEKDLDLRGTERLKFAPFGDKTRVSLTSDWAVMMATRRMDCDAVGERLNSNARERPVPVE